MLINITFKWDNILDTVKTIYGAHSYTYKFILAYCNKTARTVIGMDNFIQIPITILPLELPFPILPRTAGEHERTRSTIENLFWNPDSPYALNLNKTEYSSLSSTEKAKIYNYFTEKINYTYSICLCNITGEYSSINTIRELKHPMFEIANYNIQMKTPQTQLLDNYIIYFVHNLVNKLINTSTETITINPFNPTHPAEPRNITGLNNWTLSILPINSIYFNPNLPLIFLDWRISPHHCYNHSFPYIVKNSDMTGPTPWMLYNYMIFPKLETYTQIYERTNRLPTSTKNREYYRVLLAQTSINEPYPNTITMNELDYNNILTPIESPHMIHNFPLSLMLPPPSYKLEKPIPRGVNTVYD